MSLRDKMLAVIDDVNGSVAEREELVEMIAIALLTRKNLKLYPRKWTRDFDPWPRSADTHLTHRVRSAAPVL